MEDRVSYCLALFLGGCVYNIRGSRTRDPYNNKLYQRPRPLEIEECNLLTREQNTKTRVWRVVVPDTFNAVMKDDRMYPTGWHHREFEGHYRPPLSPQERADREAKRAARQQNDNKV